MKRVKIGKRFVKVHYFLIGNARPFRANCKECGQRRQHKVHAVVERQDFVHEVNEQ